VLSRLLLVILGCTSSPSCKGCFAISLLSSLVGHSHIIGCSSLSFLLLFLCCPLYVALACACCFRSVYPWLLMPAFPSIFFYLCMLCVSLVLFHWSVTWCCLALQSFSWESSEQTRWDWLAKHFLPFSHDYYLLLSVTNALSSAFIYRFSSK
jgi:hypothetical protein